MNTDIFVFHSGSKPAGISETCTILLLWNRHLIPNKPNSFSSCACNIIMVFFRPIREYQGWELKRNQINCSDGKSVKKQARNFFFNLLRIYETFQSLEMQKYKGKTFPVELKEKMCAHRQRAKQFNVLE